MGRYLAMKFCVQLSCDYPQKDYGAERVYGDMLDQAQLCDSLGYDAVSITEHHLVNCLMMPAPLTFAVKIAAMTQQLKILTSVVVLPLHDMRVYAGEVVVADTLCDGRLYLGVGRGAFAYEMGRMGVAMEETRKKFDESLDVLQALLSEEDVSWDGEYYQFDPLTIMPRPVRPGGPPMMMAVMNPPGIHACTKRGFHIQTTPLSGNHQLLVDQVEAFTSAKEEMDGKGDHLTMTLSRVGHVARSEAERQRKVEQAHRYYGRFDNIFTGPGTVDQGMIREIPCETPIDELEKSLLVGSPQKIIDQLGVYADLGIDRMILNMNFGLAAEDTLDSIQQFAEEVMPHFAAAPEGLAA